MLSSVLALLCISPSNAPACLTVRDLCDLLSQRSVTQINAAPELQDRVVLVGGFDSDRSLMQSLAETLDASWQRSGQNTTLTLNKQRASTRTNHLQKRRTEVIKAALDKLPKALTLEEDSYRTKARQLLRKLSSDRTDFAAILSTRKELQSLMPISRLLLQIASSFTPEELSRQGLGISAYSNAPVGLEQPLRIPPRATVEIQKATEWIRSEVARFDGDLALIESEAGLLSGLTTSADLPKVILTVVQEPQSILFLLRAYSENGDLQAIDRITLDLKTPQTAESESEQVPASPLLQVLPKSANLKSLWTYWNATQSQSTEAILAWLNKEPLSELGGIQLANGLAKQYKSFCVVLDDQAAGFAGEYVSSKHFNWLGFWKRLQSEQLVVAEQHDSTLIGKLGPWYGAETIPLPRSELSRFADSSIEKGFIDPLDHARLYAASHQILFENPLDNVVAVALQQANLKVRGSFFMQPLHFLLGAASSSQRKELERSQGMYLLADSAARSEALFRLFDLYSFSVYPWGAESPADKPMFHWSEMNSLERQAARIALTPTTDSPYTFADPELEGAPMTAFELGAAIRDAKQHNRFEEILLAKVPASRMVARVLIEGKCEARQYYWSTPSAQPLPLRFSDLAKAEQRRIEEGWTQRNREIQEQNSLWKRAIDP